MNSVHKLRKKIVKAINKSNSINPVEMGFSTSATLVYLTGRYKVSIFGAVMLREKNPHKNKKQKQQQQQILKRKISRIKE